MIKLYKVFVYILLFSCILTNVACKRQTNNVSTVIVLSKDSDIVVPTKTKTSYGVGVVNDDRLRLRHLNDLHAKTLCYLDKGEIVRIIDRDKERVNIEQFDDYWYNVEYNRIKGWVFGAYLDVYNNLEDARYGSAKYLRDDTKNYEVDTVDEAIDYNLFFISDNRIFQVTNLAKGEARVIPTSPNQSKGSKQPRIMSFFFTKSDNLLYYLVRPTKHDSAGANALYSVDINTGDNQYIYSGIITMSINVETNEAVILQQHYENAEERGYWKLSIFDFVSNTVTRQLVNLAQPENIEANTEIGGAFARTQNRENGGLSHLEWDSKKNLIYFKPYEENQTYIISAKNASWSKVDWVNNNAYDIDSSRYLYIKSDEGNRGKSIYTLMLKDRITGIEKTIIESQYYPFNFAISPHRSFVAITMTTVTDDPMVSYFQSHIYALNLSTYALTPISTDGLSYQPKWSYNFLRPQTKQQ